MDTDWRESLPVDQVKSQINKARRNREEEGILQTDTEFTPCYNIMVKVVCWILCLVSSVLCSLKVEAVESERIFQYMKHFEALPVFSEYLLHHESDSLNIKLKEQYKIAKSNSKKVLINFLDIYCELIDWFGTDKACPIDLIIFNVSHKLCAFNALKNEGILPDVLMVQNPSNDAHPFSSSSLSEIVGDSEISISVDAGKTFRLVSVFFETSDNKFIKFLLEKQGNDWGLVNKSGSLNNWTFDQFKNANLMTNFVASYVYVNENKLDDFFSFKYSKEDFQIIEDENVATFPLTTNGGSSFDSDGENEERNKDKIELIKKNRSFRKNGSRDPVKTPQDDSNNSCNTLFIPYMAIFIASFFVLHG